MGRDEAVRGAPERMTFRQRLGISDINSRAYPARVKRAHQSIGLDHWTARCVDEQRSRFHSLDLCFTEESPGLRRQRNDEYDDVGLWQQFIQRGDWADWRSLTRRSGHARYGDAKRLEPGLDGGADGSISHDKDLFACKIFREDGVLPAGCSGLAEKAIRYRRESFPLLLRLQIAVQRQALHHGKNGGQYPFGGGDVVDAASVAQDYAWREPGQDPIDAGHERLSNLQAAELWKGRLRVPAVKGKNPEVDVDRLGDGSAETDNVRLRREFCEQLTGQVLIYSNSYHAASLPHSEAGGNCAHESIYRTASPHAELGHAWTARVGFGQA